MQIYIQICAESELIIYDITIKLVQTVRLQQALISVVINRGVILYDFGASADRKSRMMVDIPVFEQHIVPVIGRIYP